MKRDCYYYNFGGNNTKDRPNYPSSYGARCEFYNKFFYKGKHQIEPNCEKCLEYKINRNTY